MSDARTVKPGERQAIDITGLTDLVSALVAYLDATLALSKALHYVSPPSLLPEPEEYALVHHVCLLWASAHGMERVDFPDEEVIRIRPIGSDKAVFVIHVPDGCSFDPHPKPAAAPRVVVETEPTWSPASAMEMP